MHFLQTPTELSYRERLALLTDEQLLADIATIDREIDGGRDEAVGLGNAIECELYRRGYDTFTHEVADTRLSQQVV